MKSSKKPSKWRPMSTAPKDGTEILVKVRPTKIRKFDVCFAAYGKRCWYLDDIEWHDTRAYNSSKHPIVEPLGWLPLPTP